MAVYSRSNLTGVTYIHPSLTHSLTHWPVHNIPDAPTKRYFFLQKNNSKIYLQDFKDHIGHSLWLLWIRGYYSDHGVTKSFLLECWTLESSKHHISKQPCKVYLLYKHQWNTNWFHLSCTKFNLLICNHSNSDLFMFEDNMSFSPGSHAKMWFCFCENLPYVIIKQ